MLKKQKMFTFMAILVLLVAAVSVAVYFFDLDFRSGVSGHPLAVDTYATDDSVSTLSTSMNTFAFDLYRQFSQGEEGNVFFSPYSLFVALAMTYEGARGTTALEMQDVLHFPQNNDTALCSFGRIYNLLNQDKEYILLSSVLVRTTVLFAPKSLLISELDMWLGVIFSFSCQERRP